MEKETFISTGLIELYVLGATSAEENTLVEQMLVKYPELNLEIVAGEKSLMKYAESQAPKPSLSVKNSIFEAINKEQVKSVNKEESKVIQLPAKEESKTNWFTSFMVAASLFLLVLSGVYNYIQYQDLQKAEDQIAALNTEKEVLANNLDTYKASYEVARNKVAILNDTANVTIPMKGLEISPNSLALIHWNKQTNETFIDIASLPDAPNAMQYQLWAIVDGVPVDLGVFDKNDSEGALQKMKTVKNPQAFAVTLEKEGGSESPTMEKMYVMGKV